MKLTIDITLFGIQLSIKNTEDEPVVEPAVTAPVQAHHINGSFEPAPPFLGYADNPQGD